jgi:hypothetical protein
LGDNNLGQLGIEGIKVSNKPETIKLKDVSIVKMSCGPNHSLLLTKDGMIYAFGCNDAGQIGNGDRIEQLEPIILEHDKRFIDIASHWGEDLSCACTSDKIYYVWGNWREKIILTPIETSFKSFNAIYTQYSGYYLKSSEDIIEFSDLSFRNGFYKKCYEEIEKIGQGSFGSVFKVLYKRKPNDFHAIKKIFFKKEYKAKVMREIRNFFVAQKLFTQYVADHFHSWFENAIDNENNFILFIRMELCDKSLDEFIDRLHIDPITKMNGALTPIGYYVASQVFIEILESINYLHKFNLIHRDLNPNNIMLKRDLMSERFIKIVDFGLMAIHCFTEQPHSGDKGQVKFMAPEVDSNHYDTRADIYSLGIIFERLFDLDEY